VLDKELRDAVDEAWRLIDFIRGRLAEPDLSEEDRINWVRLLNEVLKTLVKLYERGGVETGPSLTDLLANVSEEEKECWKTLKMLEKVASTL